MELLTLKQIFKQLKAGDIHVSLDDLKLWIRRGWFVGGRRIKGAGVALYYTPGETERLRMMALLRRANVPMDKIIGVKDSALQQMLNQSTEEQLLFWKRQYDALTQAIAEVKADPSRFLVGTDGKTPAERDLVSQA